jgi:GTP-binding protein
MIPKVAIIGRPNVGKSSLLNMLANRRISIVDPTAGVTRDRVSTVMTLPGTNKQIELIDTGGYGIEDSMNLTVDVERQIANAIGEAQLLLFVVDAQSGIAPLDKRVAELLRPFTNQKTPILLIANKVDNERLESEAFEMMQLGFGEPVAVSATTKHNIHDLIQAIIKRIDWEAAAQDGTPQDAGVLLAIVGKRNAGKSTLVNALAGSDRVIVSEQEGTTRDSVDVRFEMDGLPFLAIDTAGVRRKAKIRDDLDFYSLHRAERSIRRADVVFLFIDPGQGVTRLDKQLAEYISEQYKPCVFVLNKWDLMLADPETGDDAMKKTAWAVQHAFRMLAYAPIAFITAKTGKNVKSLINLGQAMFKQANRRVSTSALNRVLREAVEAHAPAVRENRAPKIYFATQVGTAPPTVVLFVNKPGLFDPTYQRYLMNVFREKLPFRDIPIKLYLRARTQTDPKTAADAEALAFDDSLDDNSGGGSAWAGEIDLDHEVNDLLDDTPH